MAGLTIHPRLSPRRRWSLRRNKRKYAQARRDLTAATISVTLYANVKPFTEALTRAAEAARATGEQMRAISRALDFQLELSIIRGESRWYIRGGLQPMFVPAVDRELERDIQIQAMLEAGMHPRWVAAYIRGWCDSYGTGPRDHYVLHNLWPAPTHPAVVKVCA